RHVLIAHSHGATIVLHALEGADDDVRAAVARVVLLSPLLFNCALIDDADAVRDTLVIGMAAVLPLVTIAAAYFAKALGFSRAGELVGANIGALVVILPHSLLAL